MFHHDAAYEAALRALNRLLTYAPSSSISTNGSCPSAASRRPGPSRRPTPASSPADSAACRSGSLLASPTRGELSHVCWQSQKGSLAFEHISNRNVGSAETDPAKGEKPCRPNLSIVLLGRNRLRCHDRIDAYRRVRWWSWRRGQLAATGDLELAALY